ncbi:1615_t:CDS:1, partial [Ambispora gerdemannii]
MASSSSGAPASTSLFETLTQTLGLSPNPKSKKSKNTIHQTPSNESTINTNNPKTDTTNKKLKKRHDPYELPNIATTSKQDKRITRSMTKPNKDQNVLDDTLMDDLISNPSEDETYHINTSKNDSLFIISDKSQFTININNKQTTSRSIDDEMHDIVDEIHDIVDNSDAQTSEHDDITQKS